MGTASSLQSNRYESSEQKGSDEYIEYSCDLCSSAGERVEAVGFCDDCNDYLCRMCYTSHSRNKLSKYHVLLDRDAMTGNANVTCDPCKIAGDEHSAKGYCVDCKDYLCNDCSKIHSRNRLSRRHVLLDKNNMPRLCSRETKSTGKDEAEGHKYNEEYSHTKTLDVKTELDDHDCFITGIALVSDTEVVVCDETNKSLKLIDIKNNLIRILKVRSVPNRITAICNDKVAVTLRYERKVLIISIPERLCIIGTLETDGVCVDIEYINAKLYVSFRQPVKFQVMQLTGTILKTIEPDAELHQHCTCPSRIAVSPDERVIYVSDWKRNTFMSIDTDGNMIYLYQYQLIEPCDVIISPFGLVYLCNRGKHKVYKMTSKFNDVIVILGPEDGIAYPMAMSLDVNKKRLFISSGNDAADDRNFIQVFKWK